MNVYLLAVLFLTLLGTSQCSLDQQQVERDLLESFNEADGATEARATANCLSQGCLSRSKRWWGGFWTHKPNKGVLINVQKALRKTKAQMNKYCKKCTPFTASKFCARYRKATPGKSKTAKPKTGPQRQARGFMSKLKQRCKQCRGMKFNVCRVYKKKPKWWGGMWRREFEDEDNDLAKASLDVLGEEMSRQ